MAIKITESEEKITPAKKTIAVKDVLVSELKFVDETGDITEQVINAIPVSVESVSFKITVELQGDDTVDSDE